MEILCSFQRFPHANQYVLPVEVQDLNYIKPDAPLAVPTLAEGATQPCQHYPLVTGKRKGLLWV